MIFIRQSKWERLSQRQHSCSSTHSEEKAQKQQRRRRQQNRNTRSHKFLFNGNVICYVISSFVRPKLLPWLFLLNVLYFNSFVRSFSLRPTIDHRGPTKTWLWSSESETEVVWSEKEEENLRIYASSFVGNLCVQNRMSSSGVAPILLYSTE